MRDSVGRSRELQRIVGRYRTETARTLSAVGLPLHVVLAVWPTADTLARISDGRPRALCVVQWTEEQTNDWLAANSALDLSGKARALVAPTIADPVIRAALEDLTRSINLGNRLYQPEDRDLAILTLHSLHQHRHALDPDELYRWVIANAWPTEGAGNLRMLGRELIGGRRHRTRTRGARAEDAYGYWVQQAGQRESSGQ